MLRDPLFLIALFACLGVAVILGLGVSTFGKGGTENAHRANKLMRYRIYAQFGAIVLILLFVFIRRSGGN
ncbi:twin transmembrane helix small protein [Aestuariibius insulae]|uniref:twin transmembrane helix small protein n=1 Tax=Aestuariibius insulae TaxID=2058287 RepID=UPI00345E8E29